MRAVPGTPAPGVQLLPYPGLLDSSTVAAGLPVQDPEAPPAAMPTEITVLLHAIDRLWALLQRLRSELCSATVSLGAAHHCLNPNGQLDTASP